MVRFKNRWLLVDVTFRSRSEEETLSSSSSSLPSDPSSTLTLLRTIRNSLQDNFGDVAAGALGGSINVKYYSFATRTAIVRCSRVGVREVWGALTLCNEWEGRPVRMVTVHCGGTIRKVQEAAIRINRRRIQALYREKKRLSQLSRPALLQTDSSDESVTQHSFIDLDKEEAIEVEKDSRIIKAIQN